MLLFVVWFCGKVLHRSYASARVRSRMRTAFAWASRPSQSARVATMGPRTFRPSAVTSCEVMCFWKESVLTPLNCLAYPFVGSVWFVPEA